MGILAKSCFDPESDPLVDWPYLRLADSFEFHFEPIEGEDGNVGQDYSLVISVRLSCLLKVPNFDNKW